MLYHSTDSAIAPPLKVHVAAVSHRYSLPGADIGPTARTPGALPRIPVDATENRGQFPSVIWTG
jgi:hypothetical protein